MKCTSGSSPRLSRPLPPRPASRPDPDSPGHDPDLAEISEPTASSDRKHAHLARNITLGVLAALAVVPAVGAAAAVIGVPPPAISQNFSTQLVDTGPVHFADATAGWHVDLGHIEARVSDGTSLRLAPQFLSSDATLKVSGQLIDGSYVHQEKLPGGGVLREDVQIKVGGTDTVQAHGSLGFHGAQGGAGNQSTLVATEQVHVDLTQPIQGGELTATLNGAFSQSPLTGQHTDSLTSQENLHWTGQAGVAGNQGSATLDASSTDNLLTGHTDSTAHLTSNGQVALQGNTGAGPYSLHGTGSLAASAHNLLATADPHGSLEGQLSQAFPGGSVQANVQGLTAAIDGTLHEDFPGGSVDFHGAATTDAVTGALVSAANASGAFHWGVDQHFQGGDVSVGVEGTLHATPGGTQVQASENLHWKGEGTLLHVLHYQAGVQASAHENLLTGQTTADAGLTGVVQKGPLSLNLNQPLHIDIAPQYHLG